jgi:hypothetical protein
MMVNAMHVVRANIPLQIERNAVNVNPVNTKTQYHPAIVYLVWVAPHQMKLGSISLIAPVQIQELVHHVIRH